MAERKAGLFEMNIQGAVINRAAVRGVARPACWGLSMLALAACSSLPDELNPAEWYKSTSELFAGESSADPDEEAREEERRQSRLARESDQPPPGTADAFPTLRAAVDERAVKRGLGLAADPDRPRYADAIPRQDTEQAVAVLAPKPTAPAPAPKPAAPASASTPTSQPKVAAVSGGEVRLQVPSAAQQEQQFTAIRARLQAQLAEIQAKAGQQPSQPVGVTDAMPVQLAGAPPIVVVSSGGVLAVPAFAAVTAARRFPVAAAAVQQVAPLVENRGALPVPPSAVRVATIVFNNGSARLTRNDRKILAQVVGLQRSQGGALRVVGHSSSRTRSLTPNRHRQANFRVSLQRAEGVARELTRLGGRNVLLAAVSDAQPLFFEVMPTGEAGNRRAEIYLDR